MNTKMRSCYTPDSLNASLLGQPDSGYTQERWKSSPEAKSLKRNHERSHRSASSGQTKTLNADLRKLTGKKKILPWPHP